MGSQFLNNKLKRRYGKMGHPNHKQCSGQQAQPKPTNGPAACRRIPQIPNRRIPTLVEVTSTSPPASGRPPATAPLPSSTLRLQRPAPAAPRPHAAAPLPGRPPPASHRCTSAAHTSPAGEQAKRVGNDIRVFHSKWFKDYDCVSHLSNPLLSSA